MRLHTNLSRPDIYASVIAARRNGKMTDDVSLVIFEGHGSHSHKRAFEIQLGTWDKYSLPEGTVDQYGKKMRVRRYKNSGQNGADSVWSATYFEWGWFMAEVYKLDPSARWGHAYLDADDFHRKTKNVFQ